MRANGATMAYPKVQKNCQHAQMNIQKGKKITGNVLVAVGPKLFVHVWTGGKLNAISFFEAYVRIELGAALLTQCLYPPRYVEFMIGSKYALVSKSHLERFIYDQYPVPLSPVVSLLLIIRKHFLLSILKIRTC